MSFTFQLFSQFLHASVIFGSFEYNLSLGYELLSARSPPINCLFLISMASPFLIIRSGGLLLLPVYENILLIFFSLNDRFPKKIL